MFQRKTIGLVAHDARKQDLLAWVRINAEKLSRHSMVCTGTTGTLIKNLFTTEFPELPAEITCYKSGPLGGDQQLGAQIVAGQMNILIFFTDPMTSQPHDVDVKALVRLSTVYNIVLACTRSSADFIVSSPLFEHDYVAAQHDYSNYLRRETKS